MKVGKNSQREKIPSHSGNFLFHISERNSRT